MEETILEKLAEFAGSAAPHIWMIYVRQVYIEASIIFLFASFNIFIIILLQRHRNSPNDDLHLVTKCVSVGLTLIALLSICLGIAQLLNPEFYAIQLLLGRR